MVMKKSIVLRIVLSVKKVDIVPIIRQLMVDLNLVSLGFSMTRRSNPQKMRAKNVHKEVLQNIKVSKNIFKDE